MMPFHPSFRFLLRKYIPQVSNEELDRHESLMALRLQLKLEQNMRPERTKPVYAQAEGDSDRDIRKQLIREATVQANGTDGVGIFAGFEKEFNAVQQPWIASRQLALRPSPYSQTLSVQTRWKTLLSLFSDITGSGWKLWSAEGNRLKFFKGRILTVVIILVFVVFILLQRVPSRVIEGPQGLRSGQEVGASAGVSSNSRCRHRLKKPRSDGSGGAKDA
jgi:hypothetical protein